MKTIAVFAGSFNPFHVGHLNIVQKAEDIFGKGNVFIAFGINPKKVEPEKLTDYIKDVENKIKELSSKIDTPIKLYKGFLHNFIGELEKEYNVVSLRGLRNGDDLDYEVNQLRYIDDFKKGIKTIFIVCDREYEHISSSGLRDIQKFGGSIEKYVI